MTHKWQRFWRFAAALAAMNVTAPSPAAPNCHLNEAASAIAVLDFELHDMTLTPNRVDEIDRTARVAPELRSALRRRGLDSAVVSALKQTEANKSVGYLFDHPDAAAELAAAVGAQWVAVGRLYKPSDLFAYLQVQLVDVCERRGVGDFSVEIKGRGEALLARGADALAEQLAQALGAKTQQRQKGSKP